MRSHLFVSALTIALAVVTPIGSAMVFPEVAVAQSVAEQKKEADRLFKEGEQQYNDGQKRLFYGERKSIQFESALKLWQKSLQLYRLIKNRESEERVLNNIGEVYRWLEQYDKSIESYEQSLTIAREFKNRLREGIALGNIGSSYNYLRNYPKAIEYYIQHLEILRDIKSQNVGFKDQCLESLDCGEYSSSDGLNYSSRNLGNYDKAIKFYEQNLAIARNNKDQIEEGNSLKNLGNSYYNLYDYNKAIKYHELRLAINYRTKDRKQQGNTLLDLGQAYRDLTKYGKAIEYYQQSLNIAREIKDQDIEKKALYALSDIYYYIYDIKKSIEYSNQDSSTEVLLEKLDQSMEVRSPGSRKAYISLGKVYNTFEYYEKRLVIARSLNDREEAEASLDKLIILAFRWLDYGKFISYREKKLEFYREIKNDKNEEDEIWILKDIAESYSLIRKYEETIRYYEQSLLISRKLKYQNVEASTLQSIAEIYYILQDYPKTIQYYEQSFAVDSRSKGEKRFGRKWFEDIMLIDSPIFSAGSFRNLGTSYELTGNHSKANSYYQKSLTEAQQDLMTAREQNNRRREASSLGSIGTTLVKLKQPELAIAFYKQSVNVHETIRQNIGRLPRDSQELYIKTVANTYRSLANLLIQQRRLPEAQAVLELLKLRELRDFTRDTKAIDSPGISLANIEKNALTEILKSFTTIGNFSQQLSECEKTNCSTLTQLETQRDRLNNVIKEELKTQRKLLADHYATESATLTPEALNKEARRIVNAQDGTVLIYPLILKDKIQFLLAFKSNQGGVTFRPFETNITAETLTTTITQFRNQLENPGDINTLKATSQTLYNALIKPLEPELKAANIKHLVFAPDSTIRYIPLAALHDGKQYLIQRYTISTITAASQTDTTEKSPRPIAGQNQILAMGASTFPNTKFSSLLNVPIELDSITATNQPGNSGIYPGTEVLDRAFNFDSIKTNLKTGTYKILHLATHGAFIPGNVEQSYIIPGSGPNLTSDRIDALANNAGFSNLHLVVLSACQTGVGDRASDGIEIPGISHFFLKNNVKSVLASLWNVSDASTALLMQKFYTYLAQGKTKAQALQQVQTEFLDSKLTTQDLPRAGVRLYRPGQLPPDSLAHPYFWAPFILIGNSL